MHPYLSNRPLRIDCGFPSDPFEFTYIEVASSTEERYIVSEDMHFYEPSLKKASSKKKRAIMTKRQGCVSKYLLGELDILVALRDIASAEIVARFST